MRSRLTLALWLSLTSFASAQVRPERQPARLFRLVSGSGETEAMTIAAHAPSLLEHALRTGPSEFHTLCERARSLGRGTERATPSREQDAAVSILAQQVRARRAALDAVVAQLDRAIARAPASPRLRYLRAQALESWEEPTDLDRCQVRRKTTDAIAALVQLQAADPLFEASQVAFELGLLHTRNHAFEAAAVAYRRAIALAFDPHETAVARANLGEVTMLSGDPAAALEHYTAAVALTPGGRDYALALFGAAVALDRLGEHAAAVDKAAAALENAGRSLAWLRSAGVFFEPDYELAYYEALGQEALAQLVPQTRELALETAAARYRSFIERAEPDNPYRVNAEHNLAALDVPLLAAPLRK